MQYTAVMNASRSRIITNTFYDAEGGQFPFSVSCSPHLDSYGHCGVSLSLKLSAAIELHEVFRDSLTAWELVASEWPYFVSAASEAFTSEFGYSSSELIGQTLFQIKPDHMDINAY